MVITTASIVRSSPKEKAPFGISCPVLLEFPGIKEKRVEEVAAVATQPVINPTPVIT